ncbi:acyltransferase family protein [Francisella frigiditurris]|uniref:Acyltransferase family protein n=2 Tax=Francisella frigiditurris TaxID=1542390 RepID=A0A1J0KRK6_9GAMM|nr:acyltransferase family protein [Francisella frigiditurris]
MITKISKLWRIFGTGFCIVLFSMGAFVLSYIYLPLISLIIKNKEKQKTVAQHAVYVTFRIFIFIVHNLGVIRFKFENMNLLKEDKGCLFIANHPTLIDYVAIVSKLPRCDNMVKKELWENFFYKNLIDIAGYIPNIDAEQTFDQIKDTFSKGNNLLMFPEGTRTVPGQPITFKRGAAQIALRAKAKIRLIHLDCQPVTLTKQKKWYSLPDKQPKFKITVGEKIDPTDFLNKADGLPSLAARQLTRYLQEQFIQDSI